MMVNCDRYGREILTLDQEINLPETVKRTRNNKEKIINRCDFMIDVLETIKLRAKNAPCSDDEKHSQLVQEFADKVGAAYDAVYAADRVGRYYR